MANVGKKFLYFGYGSNMLAERIHMNNATATRKGIGKLKDYRLDFASWSKRWNGSVATIVQDTDNYVWGAIWEMDVSDIPNLDRQEGVASKIYEVMNVTVETLDNESVNCRCYQLCQLPSKIPDDSPRPDDRKPSLLYLTVVLNGAKESQLPESYITKLKNIQHNGWTHGNIQKIMLIEED